MTGVTLARIEGTARSILIEGPLHTPRPALGELVAGLVAIARRHPHTAPMVDSILARTAASIDPEAPA